MPRVTLCAISDQSALQQNDLFDHLVGDRQNAWLYGEAERLHGLEVNQVEFRRFHNRQVGRLISLEHAPGINRGAAKRVG